MSQPTITQLHDPSGCASDPFTYILRDGARKLIEQAIHAELAILMAGFSEEKLADGRARLVRHGHLPVRVPPTSAVWSKPTRSSSAATSSCGQYAAWISSAI